MNNQLVCLVALGLLVCLMAAICWFMVRRANRIFSNNPDAKYIHVGGEVHCLNQDVENASDGIPTMILLTVGTAVCFVVALIDWIGAK